DLGGERRATMPQPVDASHQLGTISPAVDGRASAVEVRGTVSWLTHRDGPVSVLASGVGSYRELIGFDVHTDSGSMPGAAVMGPAGAAAGAGTAAVVATNAALGAAKSYRSASAQQAKQQADKIVSELSKYFLEQGWIGPGQAR
ncbi:hypothetical protein, partial [Methylomagnum sp.]